MRNNFLSIMRNILFMIVAVASVSEAQQSATTRTSFVTRPYDAAADVFVNLLGEDDSRVAKTGVRLLNANAPACVNPSSGLRTVTRTPLTRVAHSDGSLALPAGWTQQGIPDVRDTPTGEWTQLVARLSARPDLRADQQPQAYVSLGSEEGFPKVLLMKDTKVISLVECRTVLASSHPSNLIRATVVTPDRGPLTYVLGYAKLSDSLWVSFLSSSSNSSDAADLSAIFRSIAIRGVY
ncbi:MAG: hypothetical protein LH467_11370 [Gemmatimonadaceae bacterium]|nr:hypothetical protein [Gemmatimonadaceae bacterium]